MPKFHYIGDMQGKARSRSRASSALIITLIALLLVTFLVVSLSSMVALERASTHSSFESLKAREFASLAVEEVSTVLHDNIPSANLWAAAPGRLTVFTGPNSFGEIPLNSGDPGTSTTGTVNLNAQILGVSGGSYPIIPVNDEYSAPTVMPMAWVEVLQDGTLICSPGAGNTDRSNPVVGRYAYWVDTETSKVNLNSAGHGQTRYSFDPTSLSTVGTSDTQNLTAAPSRVDLSQLDGNITADDSLATYHYTYGGYFLGEKLTNAAFVPSYPACPVNTPGAPQGGQTFNTIEEWPLLTHDLWTGTAVSLTPSQVEQNRFYLTTLSRAPEVTPWGFNKLWWQVVAGSYPSGSAVGAGAATFGNRMNGRGAPIYPQDAVHAATNAPGAFNYNRGQVTDSRYYVTPGLPFNPTQTPPYDFQFMGQYAGAPTSVQTFINNFMVQANRTDWPGMGGKSFVAKYGQAECEDLGYNLMCLFDSAVSGGGLAPYFDGVGNSPPARDNSGLYGRYNILTVDGKTRMFGGVGEWPYINQASVEFVAAGFNGSTAVGSAASTTAPNSGLANNFVTYLGTKYYTKNDSGPGFAAAWPTNAANASQPENVAIIPKIQVVYPQGFRNKYTLQGTGGGAATGNFALVDIAVYATGTYKGAPVTYGSLDTVNGTDQTSTSVVADPSGHPYYWGLLDDHPTVSPATGYLCNSVPNPVNSVGANYSATDSYTTINFPTLYIGPFDSNAPVTDVQFRCRFVSFHANAHTLPCPTEIAPLGCNPAINATGSLTEDQSFKNVLVGAQASNGGSSTAASPTLLFDGGSIDLSSSIATPSYYTYDLIDPREYRYVADWGPGRASDIQYGPAPLPTGYTDVTKFTDPLTGVTGDSSKFAWPDIGPAYYAQCYSYPPYGVTNPVDVRFYQNASHIVNFPGIGWISVLPTNCEATQPAANNPSNAFGGKPIPWRTLSLEPCTTTSLVPDWLLFDLFAMAYDQTFCSQTQGEINVNAAIANSSYNQPIAPRLKPLEALLQPQSYTADTNNPSFQAASVAGALASYSGINSGPCQNLPGDMYVYKGQICQAPELGAGAGTQWQRESLMRNLAGLVTTQSGDFKVHVVAQAVKQVSFTGTASTDLVPTAEQRMSAIVSRVPNLGPDNIPDSMSAPGGLGADEPPVVSTMTVGSQGSPAYGTIGSSLTVTSPAFRYLISNLQYINN